jgi:hypothetical protein
VPIRFAALDIGIIDQHTKKFHRFRPKRPPKAKENTNPRKLSAM